MTDSERRPEFRVKLTRCHGPIVAHVSHSPNTTSTGSKIQLKIWAYEHATYTAWDAAGYRDFSQSPTDPFKSMIPSHVLSEGMAGISGFVWDGRVDSTKTWGALETSCLFTTALRALKMLPPSSLQLIVLMWERIISLRSLVYRWRVSTMMKLKLTFSQYNTLHNAIARTNRK